MSSRRSLDRVLPKLAALLSRPLAQPTTESPSAPGVIGELVMAEAIFGSAFMPHARDGAAAPGPESPLNAGEEVAQQEPICPCGCGRFVGACIWDPSPARQSSLKDRVNQVEQELRTGTGRFAC